MLLLSVRKYFSLWFPVYIKRKKTSLKPIFHQNAKYLASGVGVGQCTRRQNFALPNAKYTNMVYFALGTFFAFLPNAFYPTVEYRWRWAFWRWGWRWPCTFHIFCVDFICVWCPTRSLFPVEYGLYTYDLFNVEH